MERFLNLFNRIINLMLFDNRRATVLGLVLGFVFHLFVRIYSHKYAPGMLPVIDDPLTIVEFLAAGLLCCHLTTFIQLFRPRASIDDPTDKILAVARLARSRGLSAEKEAVLMEEIVKVHLHYLRKANEHSLADLNATALHRTRGMLPEAENPPEDDGEGDGGGSSLARKR